MYLRFWLIKISLFYEICIVNQWSLQDTPASLITPFNQQLKYLTTGYLQIGSEALWRGKQNQNHLGSSQDSRGICQNQQGAVCFASTKTRAKIFLANLECEIPFRHSNCSIWNVSFHQCPPCKPVAVLRDSSIAFQSFLGSANKRGKRASPNAILYPIR